MAYCTRDDVHDILTASGALAFTDDDLDGISGTPEEDLQDRIIERMAATQIDIYVESRYGLSSQQVKNSVFLKYTNAVFAACAYMTRKGNPLPPSLAEERDHLKGFLIEVQSSPHRKIPHLQETYDHLPGVTNYEVEPLRGIIKPRVNPEQSTGEPPVTRKRRVAFPIRWYD